MKPNKVKLEKSEVEAIFDPDEQNEILNNIIAKKIESLKNNEKYKKITVDLINKDYRFKGNGFIIDKESGILSLYETGSTSITHIPLTSINFIHEELIDVKKEDK